jgi:hypothetical protein
MDVLAEKIRALHERLSEHIRDYKHKEETDAAIRHAFRSQLQDVIVTMDRGIIAGENQAKLLDQMMKELDTINHRVDLLEQRKLREDGGFQVIKLVWGAAGAFIMLGADYMMRYLTGKP